MKEASSEARKATRFATSSEVSRRPWAGCVSGALEKDEYERLLSEASFQEVSVEVTQTYDEEFEIVEENGVRKDGAEKLKDAGLVSEERRGRWAFYSLDRDAAEKLLGEAAERLLSGAERRSAVGGSASG